MKQTLLIIEDDPNIADLIKLYAEEEGFRVICSPDGKEGLDRALKIKPALIVLDRMLPEIEGLELLKKLRTESDVPVLIASAKADEFEKTLGLELGADDYIAKPFSPKELMARVKAILRRHNSSSTKKVETLNIHDIQIDPDKLILIQEDKKVELTAIEFKLIYALASRPGHVFSREQLMEVIYESSHQLVYDRTIDAHVKKLRKKLNDDPKEPRYIESVFGVGYKFKE